MILIFILSAPISVHAETVTVAAASNFGATLKKIIPAFEAETGHQVNLVLGSSGKIFAQIIHKAPFDVFLSADDIKPKKLEDQDITVQESRFTYAIGKIVLWSPEIKIINGSIVQSGKFNRLAIANPKLAPYGMAAVEVLKSLGLYETVRPKIIQGENIAQTYQFVATGNADLGFIALAQLSQKELSNKKDNIWLIPDTLYSPIRQDAVMLKSGQNNKAAHDFMQFLRSYTAQKIIQGFGYEIPKEKEEKE
ncbi:MAG: molybdate ABC transporter substrate-binding protein [Emcibacter sp.]|nr:molybdate ABC transporter substrate-binding protein [Emcibacter sp.]